VSYTTDTPILLFDGVCNLCNSSVDFILRFEKNTQINFSTIQTIESEKLLSNFSNIPITDSVLFIENGQLFQESTAALKIAKYLKYFWILSYLIYLPEWIRDPVYRLLARNRYRWFGKRSTCRFPSNDLKDRFL
jgi:predicted DCC family thiol-disulfide oxidoreductase YuxK